MLDAKYIPLFLGGFVLWMIFIVAVGFFGIWRGQTPENGQNPEVTCLPLKTDKFAL